MSKKQQTVANEPKNFDHGQAEQNRVEGKNGKGQDGSTRTHKDQKQDTSKKGH